MIVFRTVFVLSRAEAQAIATFASRDNERPGICSVLLDPQSCCVVAVDGYRMGIARAGGSCPLQLASPTAYTGSGTRLIPIEAWAAFCKKMRATDFMVVNTKDGSIGKLSEAVTRKTKESNVLAYRSNVVFTEHNFTPVPWPQVLPRTRCEDPAMRVALPSDFVAEFAQIPRMLANPHRRPRGSESAPITLDVSGPHSPVTMRWCDTERDTTWVGIVMPVRIEEARALRIA
jgi:hypothetical protein